MMKNSIKRERRGDSNKVYVSNIAFDGTVSELKDHFSSVGDVNYVHLINDHDNRFKGCCVVAYRDSDMADKAIATLNRSDFKGRKLVVKEESTMRDLKPSVKRPRKDDLPRSKPSINNSQPASMETYGLSMQFLNSLQIDLPLVNTVFVANFGYDVTDDNLKEVFSLAGKIKDHEVFKDKGGNSRGFGIVEYEHPVEAVQAISMLHNQSYRDRGLVVRMDRSEKRREGKLRLPNGLKSIGMGLGTDGAPLKDIKNLPALTLANQMGSMVPMPSLGGDIMRNAMPPPMSGSLIDGMMSRQNPFGSSRSLPSRQFDSGPLFSSRSNLGLDRIIQLNNLPMDFSSDDLHKLCWKFGDIIGAEIRSNGSGIVKFNSEIEARSAVDQLDMQNIKGSRLMVTLL